MSTTADEGHLRSGSNFSDTATLTANSPTASAFIKPGGVKEGSIASGPTPIVVPPEHAARTLVLCFDGTGDQCVSSSLIVVAGVVNDLTIRFDADVCVVFNLLGTP